MIAQIGVVVKQIRACRSDGRSNLTFFPKVKEIKMFQLFVSSPTRSLVPKVVDSDCAENVPVFKI